MNQENSTYPFLLTPHLMVPQNDSNNRSNEYNEERNCKFRAGYKTYIVVLYCKL